MTNNIDYNQLLQKPIAMMTGEELTFLIKNVHQTTTPHQRFCNKRIIMA